MKLFSFCAAIMLSLVTAMFAQRNIGNTRPDGEGLHAGSGERPSRSPQPATDNPPASPTPPSSGGGDGGTIIVCCPSPPSLSIVELRVIPGEKPEVFEATLGDNEGVDFSSGEICSQSDRRADLLFSKSNDYPEFTVGNDVDIQDLGHDVSFLKLESPPKEWSPARRVHAGGQNVYIVWTWDSQFYKFLVVSLTGERAAIEWLPMDGGRRRAAADDYRNGTVRLAEEGQKFGR